MLLLAYAAPTDTQAEATSAYGVTNLFQGRTWHPDLGMYYYRARWYLPEMGEFAERDPVGPNEAFSYRGPALGGRKQDNGAALLKASLTSVSRYTFAFRDPQNFLDPDGRRVKVTLFTRTDDLAKVLGQLQDKTGLALGIDARGFLVVRKGKPKVVGSGPASGIARLLVENALYSPDLIVLRIVRDNPRIFLAQGTIAGSSSTIEIDIRDFGRLTFQGVSPRTFDLGISFLHELVHILMGLPDPPDWKAKFEAGPTVHTVNLIRKELGISDLRDVYGPVLRKDGKWVIPFNTGDIVLPRSP